MTLRFIIITSLLISGIFFSKCETVTYTFPLSIDPTTKTITTPISIFEGGNENQYSFSVNFTSPSIVTYQNGNEITSNDIKVSNNIISNIPIHHENLEKQNLKTQGYLGLGGGFIKNDLIDKMYENKKIKYKMFSISKSEASVDIDIGRITNEKINSEKSNFFLCEMVENEYKCNINIIKPSNSNVNFNFNKMFFKVDLNSKYITCPIQFLFFLDEYYFEPLVKKDICNLGIMNDNDYSFLCFDKNSDEIFKLPNLIFNFGHDKLIIFEASKLFFIDEEGLYQFIFRAPKSNIQNTDTFTVGYEFYNLINTIVDLERKEIGFYHPTYIFSDPKKENNMPVYPTTVYGSNIGVMRFVFWFLILLLAVPLSYFILIRWKNRTLKRAGKRTNKNIESTSKTNASNNSNQELKDNLI